MKYFNSKKKNSCVLDEENTIELDYMDDEYASSQRPFKSIYSIIKNKIPNKYNSKSNRNKRGSLVTNDSNLNNNKVPRQMNNVNECNSSLTTVKSNHILSESERNKNERSNDDDQDQDQEYINQLGIQKGIKSKMSSSPFSKKVLKTSLALFAFMVCTGFLAFTYAKFHSTTKSKNRTNLANVNSVEDEDIQDISTLTPLVIDDISTQSVNRLKNLNGRSNVKVEIGGNLEKDEGIERKEKLNSSNMVNSATDVNIYTDDALSDEIFELPGLQEEINFRQFSGYIRVSETKRSFYWFVESQKSPASDPLVLWTNGGPGCSGLYGFLNEQGPFRPRKDGTLGLLDESWNTVANMLFIESPTGVGFSYGTYPHDYVADDSSTAEDNYKFLQGFFGKFPQYRGNDFYLSSESYGGHYIPTLATKILAENKNVVNEEINLKGFLIGNPYTDPVENIIGAVGSFWGHQMIPQHLYENFQISCVNSAPSVGEFYDNADCVYLYYDMWDAIGNVNPYGLDWPLCSAGIDDDDDDEKEASILNDLDQLNKSIEKEIEELNEKKDENKLESDMKHDKASPPKVAKNNAFHSHVKVDFGKLGTLPNKLSPKVSFLNSYFKALHAKLEEAGHANIHPNQPHHMKRVLEVASTDSPSSYEPCTEIYSIEYLNREDVKLAIHAEGDLTWDSCSNNVIYQYKDMMNYMEPLYEPLLEAGLRVLIYSGDDDAVCATIGTQWWIGQQGWDIDTSWTPFTIEGLTTVAGYKQSFTNGFHFYTVRDAGHEVPTYKPKQALKIFTDFLNDNL